MCDRVSRRLVISGAESGGLRGDLRVFFFFPRYFINVAGNRDDDVSVIKSFDSLDDATAWLSE